MRRIIIVNFQFWVQNSNSGIYFTEFKNNCYFFITAGDLRWQVLGLRIDMDQQIFAPRWVTVSHTVPN